MADLEGALAQFQRECQDFAFRWLGQSAIIESEHRYNFLQIRIQIDPATFIELYHNAQNGRSSYALIHQQRRIFGYDGVKTWHRHPLSDPTQHESCAKPHLAQVLREMKRIVESLSAGEENV